MWKAKLFDTVTELEDERKLYKDSEDIIDAIETLKVEIKSLKDSAKHSYEEIAHHSGELDDVSATVENMKSS